MKAEIHHAFCDNINTPGVFKAIDDQINRVNVYIGNKEAKYTLMKKAYDFLIEPFNVMGLIYTV